MGTCIALIVAAGRGRRLGGEIPKQYLNLGGRPVLRHTLATFTAHVVVDAVRVVIHPDDQELYDIAALGLRLLAPVVGGSTRQESVRLGLESLVSDAISCDIVLIHDGARPFVDAGTISRVIMALTESPGAIAAIPVADTIKRAVAGSHALAAVTAATIERANLWHAQTPQGFRFADILAAHRTVVSRALTDDAAVAEQVGMQIRLVIGSEDNIKITTTADLHRAIRRYETPADVVRVGSGFDVHAFGPGAGVWLCGVKIPCDYTLIGHSDADVALHALTDALLGAVAAGDIGKHFPPSDLQWKGVASDLFLHYATNLVRALGGKIMSVDITILCEQPKIDPYRLVMIARLAEILEIAFGGISIKATTTEGLGFTGRCEGIAAYATTAIMIHS